MTGNLMVIKAPAGSSFSVCDPVTTGEEGYDTEKARIAVRIAAAIILFQYWWQYVQYCRSAVSHEGPNPLL